MDSIQCPVQCIQIFTITITYIYDRLTLLAYLLVNKPLYDKAKAKTEAVLIATVATVNTVAINH